LFQKAMILGRPPVTAYKLLGKLYLHRRQYAAKKRSLGREAGMREAGRKCPAGSRQANRKVYLAALILVLCASIGGVTLRDWAQSSVEVKVSIERTGPHGTFAGNRALVVAIKPSTAIWQSRPRT
jgi:hypothetical protein